MDNASTAAQPAGESARAGFARGWLRDAPALRSLGMVLALIVVWVIFSVLTDGVFLSARNFSNLMRQTAVTGILAVGMMLVIITGRIDLSVGSLVGLCGMAAVLAQAQLHWGAGLSVLAALLAGAAIGAMQGALTAYVDVPSFIVTLGGLLAWRGVTKGVSSGNTYPVEVPAFKAIGQSYLGASAGLALAAVGIAATVWLVWRRREAQKRHGLRRWSAAGMVLRIAVPALLIAAFVVSLNSYAGVPVPVLILVAVAAAGTFVTQQMKFGRYLYAIGGNAEAARLSGVNLRSHIMATFCILGALSGVAGVIYTARVGSAGPDAGALLELDAIAACVIGGASLMGGRGTVLGACLGALFMASLDNGMSLRNVPDFIQDIVKGAILVAAVALDILSRRRGG